MSHYQEYLDLVGESNDEREAHRQLGLVTLAALEAYHATLHEAPWYEPESPRTIIELLGSFQQSIKRTADDLESLCCALAESAFDKGLTAGGCELDNALKNRSRSELSDLADALNSILDDELRLFMTRLREAADFCLKRRKP